MYFLFFVGMEGESKFKIKIRKNKRNGIEKNDKSGNDSLKRYNFFLAVVIWSKLCNHHLPCLGNIEEKYGGRLRHVHITPLLNLKPFHCIKTRKECSALNVKICDPSWYIASYVIAKIVPIKVNVTVTPLVKENNFHLSGSTVVAVNIWNIIQYRNEMRNDKKGNFLFISTKNPAVISKIHYYFIVFK